MKLSLDQIKDVTTGASRIIFEDGFYKFFRYTEEESRVMARPHINPPAGVQLSFKTDGKVLKFKADMQRIDSISSTYFAFDVFVDGKFIGALQNMPDEEITGDYGRNEYTLGKYEGEFNLGEGEKHVRLMLPHSVNTYVEEIEISDASFITPVKRKKILAAYGDSITQGFHAVHPSKSYASLLADALDADIHNKACGGASFSSEFMEVAEHIDADIVTVAYGTNDWYAYDQETIRKNAEGFFENLQKLYPDTPTYVITPTWRSDWEMEKKGGLFPEIENLIEETFKKGKNITVIPGRDLIPHDTELFGDLWLHPAESGFEHYFKNLIKYIL